MKIALRKIGKTPSEFDVKKDKITFKGFLQYHSGKLILLEANLSGVIATQCSRCGVDIELKVDEDLKFFISDGIYEDDNNIDLDVVESFNSEADIDEILNSEIELIKSDYHTCEDCENLE